jgi:hypothetical protein
VCVSLELQWVGKCVLTASTLFAGARQGAGTEPGGDETSVRRISVWATAVSSCAQEGQSTSTPTSMWNLVLTVLCRKNFNTNCCCAVDLMGCVCIYLYVNLALVVSDGFCFKNCPPSCQVAIVWLVNPATSVGWKSISSLLECQV